MVKQHLGAVLVYRNTTTHTHYLCPIKHTGTDPIMPQLMNTREEMLTSVCVSFSFSSSDVANEMEYDERLALFRQTRLNPFDRGEDEEDGPQGGKTPPQHGEDPHDPNTGYELCSSVVTFLMHSCGGGGNSQK